MFKESDFNFEEFVKNSIDRGVFFKNGTFAFKAVIIVFFVTFIPTVLIEYFQFNHVILDRESLSQIIVFVSFFTLLSLVMWLIKDKVVFGFKDGCIVSRHLTDPYPLSSVIGYRIINRSSNSMGMSVQFYTDKNHPPKCGNRIISYYISNKGALHFSMINIVTTNNIPLITERFEKLIRRQLLAAGVAPIRY